MLIKEKKDFIESIAQSALGIHENNIAQAKQNKVGRVCKYLIQSLDGYFAQDSSGDVHRMIFESRLRAACLAGGVNKAFAMRKEFIKLKNEIRWEIHLICHYSIPTLKQSMRTYRQAINEMNTVFNHPFQRFANSQLATEDRKNILWSLRQSKKLRWRLVGKLEGLVEARQAIRKILCSDRWIHMD